MESVIWIQLMKSMLSREQARELLYKLTWSITPALFLATNSHCLVIFKENWVILLLPRLM